VDSFFDAKDPNVFSAFSLHHLAALAVFAVAVLVLFLCRRPLRRENRSRYGRFALAAVLAASEISLNVWYVVQGVYDPKDTLPLELCSISLYLCVAMLLARSRAIFQIVYFTGIGGALQALLTPVLYYDYPHFRFIEFFAAHIAIILAVLYMVWVEGFRPTVKSVFIALGFLNVLLIPVFAINSVTGGNYMFLARKPDTASLLDLLGPYPWYLLSMEAVALVIFLILYVPFAFLPRNQAGKSSANSTL
jgi:hypothetical integral membrane protein (TIGR02206 family)